MGDILEISHNCGFFSCCFVKLYAIAKYFEEHDALPAEVDSSQMFGPYKPIPRDVTYDFFEPDSIMSGGEPMGSRSNIVRWDEQFLSYKDINYIKVRCFIRKYFTPTKRIFDTSSSLRNRYDIDPDKTVALYYRGTDKGVETPLDSFESYYNKLQEVLAKEPTLSVLLQSDSAPFMDYMASKQIPNVIIIKENLTSYSDKGIHMESTGKQNYESMMNLFATFLVIAKCKHVICSSSNGSLWIMYCRGTAENVHQNLNKEWI